jgi:predicted esterase
MPYTSNESEFEVTLEPATPAAVTVILLHGLGADGWDFVPMVGELPLPMPVRFCASCAVLLRLLFSRHGSVPAFG